MHHLSPISTTENQKSGSRFTKRSYTFGGIVRDLAIALKAAPAMLDDARGKGRGLEPRFKEHVMLAVTAVNKCRYCSWVHSRLALQSGCSEPEVRAILGSDFGSLEDKELVALAFAQHYAETRGKPEHDTARKLLLAYGKEKASGIVASIQAMMIGNLMGNTLDAFQARLRGLHVEGGSPLLEFIVFLIGKPLTRLFKIG